MKNRIKKIIIGVLTVMIFGPFLYNPSHAQVRSLEEWENKRRQVLIDNLNTDLSNHPYMIEEGYRILAEHSYFSIPDSTVVAGTALVMSSAIYIYVGSTISLSLALAGSGGLLSNFFLAFSEGSVKFWLERDKFRFTVLDRNHIRHPGYCLVHTIVSREEPFYEFYEYDACYLQLLTGYEFAWTVQIPQTEDGQIRVHETIPLIGRLDDWLMGQTKVVGHGIIRHEE